jgi:serine O-acetyltransferase
MASTFRALRDLVVHSRQDLVAYFAPRNPGIIRVAWFYIADPCLSAIFTLRVQLLFDAVGLVPIAQLIRGHNVRRNGVDISPGASIGPGLVMRHPTGVVIGRGASIGRNCTILQGVTLGERLGRDGASSYPRVGSNVTIGAGATLLGPIQVGDRSQIGAGAVVIDDVAPGSTVVGIPARPTVS